MNFSDQELSSQPTYVYVFVMYLFNQPFPHEQNATLNHIF